MGAAGDGGRDGLARGRRRQTVEGKAAEVRTGEARTAAGMAGEASEGGAGEGSGSGVRCGGAGT